MIELIIPAVVAGIVSMVLGVLWYSPILFGRQWMADAQITEEQMKSSANGVTMPIGMGLGFVSQVIRMFFLAWALFLIAPATLTGALLIGVAIWAGFLATADIGTVLWEMKSWRLFFINTAYNLVIMLLGAAIIFYLL